MPTAKYRKRGFECDKISLRDQQFPDNQFYGMLIDPNLPNGDVTRDEEGNLRVLGFAKFADVGANTVRNATQAEIDQFIIAEQEDEKDIDTERAKARTADQGDPGWSPVESKQLKADIKTTVGALNREKDVKWIPGIQALRELVNEALGSNITPQQLIARVQQLGGNWDDTTNQEYFDAYQNNVDRLD